MSSIYGGIDFQSIDIKSLTDEQWAALKRDVIRKAHAERSKAIGAMVARLKLSWIGLAGRSAERKPTHALTISD